jgi:hypothetical protein
MLQGQGLIGSEQTTQRIIEQQRSIEMAVQAQHRRSAVIDLT